MMTKDANSDKKPKNSDPMDPLALWPKFAARIRDRLVYGKREYGDKSLDLSMTLKEHEVEQELFDLVGWPVLWWRDFLIMAENRKELSADIVTLEKRKAALKAEIVKLDRKKRAKKGKVA